VAGSAEFVTEGAVSPPWDGGVVGEVGLAEYGCVGASVEADGDGVCGGGDRAGGFEEAALQHVLCRGGCYADMAVIALVRAVLGVLVSA